MSYFTINPDEYHPDQSYAFDHDLVGHPLLKLEKLKELALRLPRVRHHSAMIDRTQRLDTVLDECPSELSLEQAFDNIETAGSFVFLMDVQNDPEYGPFIHSLIDEIQGNVEKHHHNLRNRQAWIFVTSPGGTTPYHRDQEASHFLHIKGSKTFWLWDQTDRKICSQEENECFHGVHSLKETKYNEGKLDEAKEYNLVPGNGIYFPYTAPHMVLNGSDEYAISISVTHMTDENFNERRINKINQLLRKFNIKPKDYKASKLSDSLKLFFHWNLRTFLGPLSANWREV